MKPLNVPTQQPGVEPRPKRKCRRSALPWWCHFAGLIPLSALILLILIGPGFHLRQGWAIVAKSKGNTNVLRYACDDEKEVRTKWSGEDCKALKSTPKADTQSLIGYDGVLGTKNLKELELDGQYACSIMAAVVSLAKFAIGVMAYVSRNDKVGPIRLLCPFKLLPYLFVFVVMSILFCMQVHYFTCGSYPFNKLDEYDKTIKKLVAEKKLEYKVDENDRVVECMVVGYAIAAMLALLTALIAIVDARLLYKESKRRKVKSLAGDTEETSVTSDMLEEHGCPDELHMVGGSDRNAPSMISIQGGISGKVEISNLAKLMKSKELSCPEAKKARQSFKKDNSAQEYDARRKDAVYKYLYEYGGSLLDPVDKKSYYRVEPGQRDKDMPDEISEVKEEKPKGDIEEFFDMI